MFEHENILYDKLPALEAKSMTKLDESESGIMVLERWFNHVKNCECSPMSINQSVYPGKFTSMLFDNGCWFYHRNDPRADTGTSLFSGPQVDNGWQEKETLSLDPSSTMFMSTSLWVATWERLSGLGVEEKDCTEEEGILLRTVGRAGSEIKGT